MSQVASRAKINSPPLWVMMDTLHKVITFYVPSSLFEKHLDAVFIVKGELSYFASCVLCLQEGYAASRSHIASNAIKTNCPMAECMRIAKSLRHSLPC